jgi:hypothetical protein
MKELVNSRFGRLSISFKDVVFLIIIHFSKSCRPLQTAKNEDITHIFLQLIQYIVN